MTSITSTTMLRILTLLWVLWSLPAGLEAKHRGGFTPAFVPPPTTKKTEGTLAPKPVGPALRPLPTRPPHTPNRTAVVVTAAPATTTLTTLPDTHDLSHRLRNLTVVTQRKDGCDVLARACLANKTVIFTGSSVSRQWAFILIAYLMMCPTCVQPRSIQKELCGSTHCRETFCHCYFTLGTTTVRFIWLTEVHHAGKFEMIATYVDAALSRHPDATVIMVVEPGFHVLVGPGQSKRPSWPVVFQRQLPQLNVTLSAFLRRFGTRRLHLYWRTLTPMSRVADRPRVRKKPSYYAAKNRNIRTVNGMIQRALPAVQKIDVYWETLAHLDKYDDVVHHIPLIPEFLRQLLERECQQPCRKNDQFDAGMLSR